MNVDVGELVLFDDSPVDGDTFIFEPSRGEEHLGRLLAAAEVEDRGDVGRELIDTVIHALQREYYRDPSRGMLASFESALHQANLVLHDMAEQGMRDWMGSFHVAVGVLAKSTLHVSTTGDGVVLLARQSQLTAISAGLSHSPITDPLRTFAQVASGVASNRDVIFLGTSALESVFGYEDLARFVVDHSAVTIATRLRQLYEDQHKKAPVAVLVVSLLPQLEVALHGQANKARVQRDPVATGPQLTPRAPLNISRSLFRRVLVLLSRLLSYAWRKARQVVWPLVKEGSRRGGGVLYRASRSAGRNVKTLTERATPAAGLARGKISWGWVRRGFSSLPTSSKVFAVLALVLVVALTVSLGLLQKKRTADVQFQQASELLHEARTKKEAAETALIYDNRDQARTLLKDAEELTDQIQITGLYQEQTQELVAGIVGVQDRLDKVTRVTPDAAREVGDFSALVGRGELSHLFYLQSDLYSFDPRDNTIVKMDQDGNSSVVSQTTSGIGFFTVGTTHEADKSLVLITDSPGMALYDAKTELVQKQEVSFPSSEPEITSLSTYGNRLYLYDRRANNIYGYSKTLRGYSGGNAWITAADFPRDTISSIGVDGYVYTLHDDGTIRKLLKGVPVDFAAESVEPPLTGSARLLITEDLKHLYVFDLPHKRVVVFDTVGNLSRQIFLGDDSTVRDIAVDPKETTLYVLDGTKVRAISLLE